MRHLALPFALCVVAFAARSVQAADDAKALFDGQSLDGWQAVNGPISSWTVEDGLLVCSGAGGGWLSTKDEYGDFDLSLEFRVPQGGNSGVFIRAPHEGDPAYTGMELQVLDDAADEYKSLRPDQYTGSVYGVVAAQPRVTKPAGEWQTMRIRCVGRDVEVEVNGKQVVKANLDEHLDKAKEHPGITRERGHIGLQNHGSRVEYRNVKLAPVK
ncbi:MAG: DUF1080 domain-containing protein [Pirellulales bacterium]|nr:DUF1080 domain-containing protein [Pirellulales bacterium]